MGTLSWAPGRMRLGIWQFLGLLMSFLTEDLKVSHHRGCKPVCYLLGLWEAVESWAWPALGGGMEQVWTDTVMAGAFC